MSQLSVIHPPPKKVRPVTDADLDRNPLRGCLYLRWARNRFVVAHLTKHIDDNDFTPQGLYPDGVQVRWRKPLVKLREFFELLKQAGVRSAVGYWLPTGHGCLGDEDGILCEEGAAYACDATPGPDDWFKWTA